jgi:hypothetical protein
MAPPPTKQTGRAFLVINNCRSVHSALNAYIGGQHETVIPDEYNQWRQLFSNSQFTGHSIVGCNEIVEWHNCIFQGEYITWDQDIDGTGGYDGWLGGDRASKYNVADSLIEPQHAPKFGWVGPPP